MLWSCTWFENRSKTLRVVVLEELLVASWSFSTFSHGKLSSLKWRIILGAAKLNSVSPQPFPRACHLAAELQRFSSYYLQMERAQCFRKRRETEIKNTSFLRHNRKDLNVWRFGTWLRNRLPSTHDLLFHDCTSAQNSKVVLAAFCSSMCLRPLSLLFLKWYPTTCKIWNPTKQQSSER